MISTFAYTDLASIFMGSYDHNEDTAESLGALVDEFIDAHRDYYE